METKQFGVRLRQLRQQSGLSQRGLASKVSVNFTYLSKIENGVVAAPSKSVTLRLAEVLNADKDELLILAGRIPSDVTEMLSKDPEILQLIRSPRAHKILKASNKIRTGWHNLSRSLQNSMEGVGSFFKNHQGLSRVAISVAIVLAIVAGLWAASPAQALNITFPSLPSGNLGRTHTFQVRIEVQNVDLLPIKSIDLDVYNSSQPSYNFSLTNLRLTTGSNTHTTGIGSVNVSAVTGAGWGRASASRRGYGYGYTTGWGYQYGTGTDFGYGYAYDSYIGTTDITYTIAWTPPAAWPSGTYEILVRVSVNGGAALTTPTPPTFTLSTPAPPEPPPEPGVTDVSDVVDESGVFTEEVIAESEDGQVTITIDEGITGLTEEGEALSEINIVEMAEEDVPIPPAEGHIIGLTYDFGPDGATFSSPITLTFTYDPDNLPDGVNEEDLVIAIWDEDAGAWVELPSVVDTVNNIVTATVSHFTPFAIIVPPPVEEEEEEEVVTPPVEEEEEEEEEEVITVTPAAFSVSYLSIGPRLEVEAGDTVAITVLVANTGGKSGSYTVVLKIDGVKEAEETVTVAAGESQDVSFSVTREEAGSYAVTVDGLSGSFTIGAPEEEKEEEVVTPPVVGEEEGLAWWIWLIVGLGSATAVGLLLYFLWYRPRRPPGYRRTD